MLPVIKKLMEKSRGDALVRHALAKNIALIAKVGVKLLEVAQGSAIRIRQEIREKREQMRRDGIRDSVDLSSISFN